MSRQGLSSWGVMTHWTPVDALVVQEPFLEGHFLLPDLLPCHILQEAGQEVSQCIAEVT